ncbi:peroxiredoxin family protein [Lacinutrix mariniflava]|uniref:peroxiredoxin family protein n=1 Tax=Lacinutrix mariniflava TaxID=342955 RepID=UPI0006E25AFD|nr:redoxin domain-containing protein [Lacinutrix mariniflava]
MSNTTKETPIQRAQEFNVKQWIDANGNKTEQIKLSDFKGQFKILYCFQSSCPGCHSKGLPDLKKMVEGLKDNKNITFLAIQTVFEGHESNTYEKLIETQKQYNLKIPFGHDAGDDNKSHSNIMANYKTGGTPWFIIIDKHDNIVFSDFSLNPDAAIQFLKTLK